MYPYCSPHPARQPYPSHAQKHILERLLVKKKKKKKNCNDDERPMKGMESCPTEPQWDEGSVHTPECLLFYDIKGHGILISMKLLV